jgi:hypothetical protein
MAGGNKSPKIAKTADSGDHKVSDDMPEHPPRLSVALLWAQPGHNRYFATDLEKNIYDATTDADKDRLRVDLGRTSPIDDELRRLLGHVYQRLEKGLDEAWYSKYGYAAPVPPEAPGESPEERQHFNEASQNWANKVSIFWKLFEEPEEKWARAFTEMFAYIPYAGPGQFMLGSGGKDYQVYLKWPDVYATIAACQHITTYGALTRGIDKSLVAMGPAHPDLPISKKNPVQRNGMTAGPNSSLAVFGGNKAIENSVPPTKRPCWIPDKITSFAKLDLQPGDVVSGTADSSQTGWSHAASVLRRWPIKPAGAATPGNDTAAKLQMLDTGVLSGATDSSTQDQEWQTDLGKFTKADATLRGFGRLPAAGDLAGAVTTMKSALPIGFARLVLLEPGGQVRYVSAVLPMWHGSHRFSVARYIWSLRKLPAVKGRLMAYWVILAPHGANVVDSLKPGAERTWEAEVKRTDVKSSLSIVAILTNEPRVLRTVQKGLVAWSAVEPTSPGSGGAPTVVSSFYDEGKALDAYNNRKAKAEKEGKPFEELPPEKKAYPMESAKNLPLKLDAGPGGRRGGWAFMGDTGFLSTELVFDASTNTLKERPMAASPIQYFNGTAKDGAAAAPSPPSP